MNKIDTIPKYNSDALRNKAAIEHLPASERIRARGYRSFIGSHNAEEWYSLGRLQYYFLVSRGLESQHVFLDVGCGSLRLGQFLIPFLGERKYFGLEPESILVECGLAYEVPGWVSEMKKPTFSHNYQFEMDQLDCFDYAMANSILTHLVPSDIRLCFSSLRSMANQTSVFYFTFFEGDSKTNPKQASHANKDWRYSIEELQDLAEGWRLNYIGDWGHPRGQMMVEAKLE